MRLIGARAGQVSWSSEASDINVRRVRFLAVAVAGVVSLAVAAPAVSATPGDRDSAATIVGVPLTALEPGLVPVIGTKASPDPAVQSQWISTVVTPASVGLSGKLSRAKPEEFKQQGSVTRTYSASRTGKLKGNSWLRAIKISRSSSFWFGFFAVSEAQAASQSDANRGFELITETLATFMPVHRDDQAGALVATASWTDAYSAFSLVLVQRGNRLTASIFGMVAGRHKSLGLPDQQRMISQTLAQNAAPAQLLTLPPLGEEIARGYAELGGIALNTTTYRIPARARGDIPAPFKLRRRNYSRLSTSAAVAAVSSLTSASPLAIGGDVQMFVAGFEGGSSAVWVRAVDLPSGYEACVRAPRHSHKSFRPAACPTSVTWTAVAA